MLLPLGEGSSAYSESLRPLWKVEKGGENREA
jgi:hypothetical protein